VDAVRLSVLRAEVQGQLNKIEQVFATLEGRASEWAPDDVATVESVAYQVHNFYSAIEDLMKIVAKAFENSIADLSQWHTQLLNRMTLEIEGVRPALLTTETATLLDELRAFRHLFRHAYGATLDFYRVEQNVVKARQARPLLLRDVQAFLDVLKKSESRD
jgi:hypothetical protein